MSHYLLNHPSIIGKLGYFLFSYITDSAVGTLGMQTFVMHRVPWK